MSLKYKNKKVEITVTYIYVDGVWAQYDLVDMLFESIGSFGFNSGVITDTKEEDRAMKRLEKNGYAEQSIRGGWFGTEKLKKYMEENGNW